MDIQDIWPDALIIKDKTLNVYYLQFIAIHTFIYPCDILISLFTLPPFFENWLSRYSKKSKSQFIPLGFDSYRWKNIAQANKAKTHLPN